MVYLPSLLLGLSAAGSTTAYRYNYPAKISLFPASEKVIIEAFSLTAQDCGAGKPSTDIILPINTCLWGDYSLVNNFKVTSLPTCANGAIPVTYFYDTTSCTGNPTFRSDEAMLDVADRCLFGSSTPKWSMIFRCENLESQAVAKGYYMQAIPPNYSSLKKPGPKASDGVITPHGSYDCTIWKAKEPTFLPADTCLTLDVSHSIFINQPAVCASGKTAVIEAYAEPGCETSIGWLGSDAFSNEYGPSLDKKCHTTQARSIQFKCHDKDSEMFEDLPPHEHADVKPLVILAPPATTPTQWSETDESVVTPQKPQGYASPTASTKAKHIVHFYPEDRKNLKPLGDTKAQSTTPQGGKIQPYYLKDCKNDKRSNTVSVQAVDTCIWTFMYNSMQVVSPAICKNGTQALFAQYSRPGCKPEDMKSIGDIPKVFTEGCADIENINSFAFWCEGLPDSEIGNKGSVGGFVKMILIILLVVVLMIGLSVLSCCLRGAAMMKQANELWGHIMAMFGKKEGAIQL
jgi:hypothetical protein